jgi:hypothetical protein
MIFLFTFCLYYVLHNRHRKTIVPNSLIMSSDGHLPQREQDFPSMFLTKTTFIGFSDYRFILCLILLLLLGLMAIPIGGLTTFHIYLISQGRTTNEQVTGKYRTQNDAFNRGYWKNFTWACCQSLYPRLKASKIKHYNVDLFEQMAYGKSKYKLSNNGHEQKVKINLSNNGRVIDQANKCTY